MAFSPDSRFIAGGSQTGNVNIWRFEGAEEEGKEGDASGVAEKGAKGDKPDGTLEVRGQFAMSVAYVRLGDGAQSASPGAVDALAGAQSASGKYVACGHKDGVIHVFDLQEGKLAHRLAGAPIVRWWDGAGADPPSSPPRPTLRSRDGGTFCPIHLRFATAGDSGRRRTGEDV